jgi:tripartite-type tricarboxylate transporter receptor subunit TctC
MLALGALPMLWSSPGLAQAYPAKPIEITVHTSAGSGGDLVSRLVSEVVRREKLLPQPLMVTNRVGGAGVIAFNYFKERRGDPYQLLSVTGTLLAMAYRADVNIGLENYTPVALMAIDPQTIMVPADSPYKTFKELVEAARKDPNTLVAATTSIQGTGRMVIYLIEKAVPGARFRFVTFKGGADAVTATAGGLPPSRPRISAKDWPLSKAKNCGCWRSPPTGGCPRRRTCRR